MKAERYLCIRHEPKKWQQKPRVRIEEISKQLGVEMTLQVIDDRKKEDA